MAEKITISERLGAELRFDAFNVSNHWNPGQPGDTNVSNPSDTQVGVINQNNSQNSARILQISGRITF